MMEINGVVMRHGIMTWTYVNDGDIWCGDEAWHYDMDIR